MLAGCHGFSAPAGGPDNGDPDRGARLVEQQACGSCHLIPGRADGFGLAGPPLSGFAHRTMIAGRLPNTPDRLVEWLQDPQAVAPGNVMPDMGLSRAEAKDIAAFLYTLD